MRQTDLVRPNGWCNSLLIYVTSFMILAFDTTSWAHGFAGDRFFPPTIQTDDPFAADELAFPTVSTFKNADSPPTRETGLGVDFSKVIFPRFALGISEEYVHLAPEGQPSVDGWNNLNLSAK